MRNISVRSRAGRTGGYTYNLASRNANRTITVNGMGSNNNRTREAQG